MILAIGFFIIIGWGGAASSEFSSPSSVLKFKNGAPEQRTHRGKAMAFNRIYQLLFKAKASVVPNVPSVVWRPARPAIWAISVGEVAH